MKRSIVLLALLSTACLAQERACPIAIAAASTDVRLQNGNNVVIWFENQGHKTLERARLELFMLDGSGNRQSASTKYVVASQTAPGQTGLAVRSTEQEQQYFGENWRAVRGLEVSVVEAVFSDGTRWEPSPGTSCSRRFSNSQYEPNLRQWHRELRANWNRQHPEDPIPDPTLQSLLQPDRDGWR